MSIARAIALLLCAASLSRPQPQQNPEEVRISWVPYATPSTHTFTAEVRLLEVPAVVRDSKDRVVRGLEKNDFQLFDNGKQREITAFSVVEAAAPRPSPASSPARPTRFVALVIDDLYIVTPPCIDNFRVFALHHAAVAQMIKPAQRFLKENLQPGDQVSIFDMWRGQVMPFSSDAAALAEAIGKLTVRSQCGDPNYKLYTLHDIVDYMARLPGSRSIVLTSRSIRGDTYFQTEVVNRAVKAGVVINSLNASGLEVNRPGDAARVSDALSYLSQSTGGLYFHNNNDFTAAIKQLAAVPGVSYLLGFVPDDARDGRYHSLKVKVARPEHYSVQSRPGYYNPDQQRPAAPDPDQKLNQAVLGSDTLSGVPVTFTASPGVASVSAEAHVDILHLPFRIEHDRRMQRLTMIAVLEDSTGACVTGRKGIVEFALKDALYQTAAPHGLRVSMVLEAPPGRYQLRTVVREDNGGSLSASTQPIDIAAVSGH